MVRHRALVLSPHPPLSPRPSPARSPPHLLPLSHVLKNFSPAPTSHPLFLPPLLCVPVSLFLTLVLSPAFYPSCLPRTMQPPASGTGHPLPHRPRQLLLQQKQSMSFQKGLTHGVGVTATSPETAGISGHLLFPEPLSPGAPVATALRPWVGSTGAGAGEISCPCAVSKQMFNILWMNKLLPMDSFLLPPDLLLPYPSVGQEPSCQGPEATSLGNSETQLQKFLLGEGRGDKAGRLYSF